MMARSPRMGFADLGLGIGLRSVHFRQLLQQLPEIDWFEIISENYLDSQGWRRHVLRRLAERYPMVMHGVSLSIGSCDPLDFDYLTSLKQLAKEIGARWISDHLCWTGVAGQTTHDLLPLPLNEETLAHVVARIRIVQDVLERPLIVENPSSYARFNADTLPEWEFMARMAADADCGLLLDVNNIYVSSFNHGFDPRAYIDAIPAERVVQMHLAGHRHCGSYIIDTHDSAVSAPVWQLYRHAVRHVGPVSTLLEWDAQIPDLDSLHAEVLRARDAMTAPELELPRGDAWVAEAGAFPRSDAVGAYPVLAGAGFDA